MQLHYQKFGNSGTPLILLHGLFGMGDNWVAYGKRIAEWGYTVYLPDQRNHGRSPHHRVFNYLALTDDLADLVEQIDLEQFVLMGHSMGGKVAMRYALENPSQIKKLIVVDISMRAYQAREHHKKIIHIMKNTQLADMFSRKAVEAHLRQEIKEERLLQFVMKNLKRTSNMQFTWKLNIDAIYEHLDHMFDSINHKNPFDTESLFIRGGNSDYVSDADVQQIQNTFTSSQIFTIPHAGHWVQVDQPQEFTEHLHHFLKP